MKSEIKDLYGFDYDSFKAVDYPLEKYIPKQPNNFSFWLSIEVGISGKEGADLFEVFVCTPQWFLSHTLQEKIMVGLHCIIVAEYNYQTLRNKLEELFCIEGASWFDIAKKLSYYGRWENQVELGL